MTAKYKVAITAGAEQSEIDMKTQYAFEMGLYLIYTWIYEVSIYGKFDFHKA